MSTLNQLLELADPRTDCGLRLLDRHERAQWQSWREVHQRAEEVAASLQSLGIRHGQTVGLFYPTEFEFFTAFFGTLLAGAVPAPFYPPVRLGRLTEYRRRTVGMLRAAGVSIALSSGMLRRILGEVFAEAQCRAFTVLQLPSGDYQPVDVTAEDLALVQFSSGTTVDPKPVALTHRAVLSQTEILNSFWPDTPEVRHTGVCWLPLYHDMGLIGCVFPALQRPSELTLLPPELFVARPALWLRAISRYCGTVSPAPNFAYRLCVDRITDEEMKGVDLSCWHVALNGAEAVVPTVLRAFVDRFTRWGFRAEALTPVYGLSEASLAVTFSPIERRFVSRSFSREALTKEGLAVPAERELELVSVGHPVPGFEVQIRDETGACLEDGRIGRIWTRGPSLMKCYLNNPEATSRAFQNGWLDTGDLGFVHEGELYVSGRAKDILIVRGQNHAPEEIEMIVDEVPGVRRGCRAAVNYMPPEAEREEIWLFVERQKGLPAKEISTMAESCAREVAAISGIQLDRVEVLEPGTLPRTSSGKIRRAEALRQFLSGELVPPDRVTTGYMLRAMGKSLLADLRARRSGEETDSR